ncbi:MAG: hypothetical protein R3A52_15935 [Polyangiales bacterium]
MKMLVDATSACALGVVLFRMKGVDEEIPPLFSRVRSDGGKRRRSRRSPR